MTNPEEDVKLNDPAYQQKLAEGMVEGICDYFGRSQW
jgi:N-acetylmuramoyl-L-alanine amidase